MKKVIILIGVVIATVSVWYLLFRKKTTVDGEIVGVGTVAVDAPPPDSGSGGVKLFTDSGDGLIAIESRIRQISGTEYQKQAAQISESIFNSVTSGMWGTYMGGAGNIVFPLNDVQKSTLRDAKNAEPSGTAKDMMRLLQGFNGRFVSSGMPKFLSEEAKGGGEKNFYKNFLCNNYTGCPSIWGGSNAQVRKFEPIGRAAIADLKTVSANITNMQNLLDKKVREKAIQELVDAGWKFQGMGMAF